MLVDLQQPGQGGLFPGEYGGHPAVSLRSGKGEFKYRQVSEAMA
jgi:hypothetical protein